MLPTIVSPVMDDVTRIPVPGDRPYDVLVGRDLLGALPALIDGAARAAVLYAPPLKERADAVAGRSPRAGIRPLPIEVPDAEAGKTIEVAARCWDALGAAGFTRTDAVVGVGGGAVTDLAGYVAASWLRGVRWVPVSTSLLGMVDAAVGGKTGVNTAAGKNLVGAFHPPAGVLCDLDAARHAARRRPGRRAGRGRQVRLHRRPGDPRPDRGRSGRRRRPARRRCSASWSSGRSGSRPTWSATTCASRGCGRSSTTATRWLTRSRRSRAYTWRHGHAVAVGLVFAAELSRLAGRLDDATAARHRAVLELLGLPTSYRADAWPDLLAAMRVDKKARADTLRFVVLDGLAKPGHPQGPPTRSAASGPTQAVAAMSRSYVLNGPEPGPAGHPPGRRLRRHDVRGPGRRCASRPGASWGSTWWSGRPTPSTRCSAGCTPPPTSRRRWCSTRAPGRITPTRSGTPARCCGRPWSRCTSPTSTPGRSSGTTRWSRRWPPGSSRASASTATAWPCSTSRRRGR